LLQGVYYLRQYGIITASRNGPTIEAPGPVTTQYLRPCERVLFDPRRDANPFFHLFEAIWMLGGRNDLSFIEKFNKRIREYSDDGITINGSAYGYRWRHKFGKDLLEHVIVLLRKDPTTRRAYLPHWDPTEDGLGSSRDYPCNVGISFQQRAAKLRMTVFNRSNDILWGAYGANAVHFSFLQEYVARSIECHIDSYYQVSDSFHAYTEFGPWKKLHDAPKFVDFDFYSSRKVLSVPLWSNEGKNTFDDDVQRLLSGERKFKSQYFLDVVEPMWAAWDSRSLARLNERIDWHRAGVEWLRRRGYGSDD
jgi:hypothetical protein